MQVTADPHIADANRTAHENIIQRPDDRVRALLPAAKGIFVARMREFLDDLFHRMTVFCIQVARDHNWSIVGITAGIGEGLVELGGLYTAGPAGLARQILNHPPPALKFPPPTHRPAPPPPPPAHPPPHTPLI